MDTLDQLEGRIERAFRIAVVEGDPFNAEANGESNAELASACLDSLYVVTEGRLWEDEIILGIEFPDSEEVSEGLRGSLAELIPLIAPSEDGPGEIVLGIRNKGEKGLMSQRLFLEASLTENGHQIKRGRYALKDEAPTTIENVYSALASISLSSLASKRG